MVGFQNSTKGWKGKFFFVKSAGLGEWAAGMRWRESVKMADHIPVVTEYNDGSVRRISILVLDVRELQESVLYASALSLVPIEQAGQLMYQEKCRCSKKF